MESIRWSDKTQEEIDFRDKVENLYRKGIELVKGRTICGLPVNLNNPKEIVAVLYLLAEDFNRYHERI